MVIIDYYFMDSAFQNMCKIVDSACYFVCKNRDAQTSIVLQYDIVYLNYLL